MIMLAGAVLTVTRIRPFRFAGPGLFEVRWRRPGRRFGTAGCLMDLDAVIARLGWVGVDEAAISTVHRDYLDAGCPRPPLVRVDPGAWRPADRSSAQSYVDDRVPSRHAGGPGGPPVLGRRSA